MTASKIIDRLLANLKRRASQIGSTLSKPIEDSVRLLLGRQPAKEPPEVFELLTFGAGGHIPTQSLDKTGALLEPEDIERDGPRDR